MNFKLNDLIAVRAFPAVVQADDIRALRDTADSAAIDDFVAGYLGFDERSREALRVSVQALAGNGGAFFLNGVFGSGKSHLLGLLALLCDGRGHEAFARLHPQLAPLLSHFTPRLVVHASLDAYDAARFTLESIVWCEIENEWHRRSLPGEALAPVLQAAGSRTEQWQLLEEVLQAHQLGGVVLCIDELSLFLSAKEHRALQADAAFLQFLGQRARRQSTSDGACGLWIWTALQKTVESIGDIEAYSLSQIRDRFVTLPLATAHIPSLIEHRLIIKRDAEALHRLTHESFESTLRALPRLDFGREEWERLFPFHPTTVALLEATVARFFSRTRSAVLFCAHSIAGEAPANTRILPDALFNYLAPELDDHPDLRPLAGVWRQWQESVADIAGNAQDSASLRRLMQGLLLFKIAGVTPTSTQLTNALHLDMGLPGDGNYQYARVLLERLHTRGSFLAVERHEDSEHDRYTVDAGSRVGDMARRAVQSTLCTLADGDARISQYAMSCCRNEPLPLSLLEEPRSFTPFWRNAPRPAQVALWTNEWTGERLANALAALAMPGQPDDWLLLIAPPFGTSPPDESTLRDALTALPEPRWRGALVLWTPRSPLPDEWQSAREATAQHLLESDPQLLDNRRGRAVLAHLKQDSAAREARLARLAVRLLREGVLTTGGQLALDAGELAHGETWIGTTEAIAEWALPHLLPQWEEVAPRLRVLTPGNIEQLCLELLRRPLDAPFFSPSLERAVRGLAEPLGIAKMQQGRWAMQAPRADLAQAVKAIIGAGVSLNVVEATMSKSEWGLRAEQTHLLLCALLRNGEIVAHDGRGTQLAPAQIGLPLRRAIHALRPGEQIAAETWLQLREVLHVLGVEAPASPSFATQEAARNAVLQWREQALSETELAQARLHQMRRQLGHNLTQWPQTGQAWEQIEALLHALQPTGTTSEVLLRAATLDAKQLQPALGFWRQQMARLEERQTPLLTAQAFLSHPQLAVPADLQEARCALLARLQNGETVLEDDELLEQWQNWHAAYATKYLAWHATQHAPARWNSLRRLASSDLLRAGETLQALRNRNFSGAAQLRGALDDELDKACPRDGQLSHEPVCPGCRLRWNERVALRNPVELEALAAHDIGALHALLKDDAVRIILRRHPAAAALLDWANDEAVDAEALRPLLSDEAVMLLDDALRPRRCVTRSRQELWDALQTCRTRDDFQSTFHAWLDGGEHLAEDDEIVMEN